MSQTACIAGPIAVTKNAQVQTSQLSPDWFMSKREDRAERTGKGEERGLADLQSAEPEFIGAPVASCQVQRPHASICFGFVDQGERQVDIADIGIPLEAVCCLPRNNLHADYQSMHCET